MRTPGRSALVLALALGGCTQAGPSVATYNSAALGDSLRTLYDSLSQIHQDHPDTGLLRRLHPPADTILFVEGAVIESLTGDSLFRRVRSLHAPVTAMRQHFDDRAVQVIDRNHAVLTARESVDWTDHTGAHHYAGLLTLVTRRRGERWVIVAYRGS